MSLNCKQTYDKYMLDARTQYFRLNISMYGHDKKSLAKKLGISLNTLNVHLRNCKIEIENIEVIA